MKSSDEVDAINEYFDLIDGLVSIISDELPCINVELVESCIKQLSLGKSAGADSIVAEPNVLLSKYNNPYKAVIYTHGLTFLCT